jgi:hypothetical protein
LQPKKLELGITTVSSWAKMIMLYCHDEKAGFDNFLNFLDDFKQRHQNLESDSTKKTTDIMSGSITIIKFS